MLSAATLLQAWERAGSEPPPWRSLRLLAAAFPERPADGWAEVPVGRRDAALLDLREAAFGGTLESVVACAGCGELLELSCAVAELRAEPDGEPITTPLVVRRDGVEAVFRLPTTRDVLAVVARGDDDAGDVAEGARRLLARCLDAATHDGRPVAVDEMPVALLAEVEERMEAADPQANVRLALTCPACGEPSQPAFDIGSYLWAEVDAWARRTLAEVHAIASAYGWSEPEILALTAARRELYLGMIRR